MNITLNFCQKACVSIPTDACSFSVLTWTSSDTSLINVFANGNNAILKPVYGATGFVAVTATDIIGSSFIIFVTITSYFDVVVTLPQYKYLYSLGFNSVSSGGNSSATINGPFNSLIVPFTLNACVLIGFTGLPFNSWTFYASFLIPASSAFVKVFGNFPLTVDIAFALFMPTTDTQSDPLLLFGSLFNNSGPTDILGTTSNSRFYTTIAPICEANNYNSIVQWNWPNSTIDSSVIGSQFLSDSSIVFQIFNFTSSANYNAIVIPNNYYNLLSTSLVFSQRFPIIFNTTIQTFSITIPVISVGSVIWFAQQYGITITEPGIRILSMVHISTTQIDVTCELVSQIPIFPLSKILTMVAYRNQTNIGFSITFP